MVVEDAHLTPQTTIVVPVWDHEAQHQFTRQIVEQILFFTQGDFQLVVVDNASPYPETPRFLREAALADSRLHVITNEENRGYGPALNQGLRLGYEDGCDFFVCLNNDILIQDANWLDAFIVPLQQNNRQLVGARMITFNPNCDFGQGIVPYVEGWALAFHRLFLEEVGYFDEEIWLWFEDVELSLRARKAGYEILQSPAFEWRNDRGLPIRGPLVHLYGCTAFRSGLDFETTSAHSKEIVREAHFGP